MPFRKPGIQDPEGQSGNYKRVQGRHVFVPSTDESPDEIGEKEIERWEHPTPSFKKDKFQSVEDSLNVRNIHADGAKESETYIGEPSKQSKMEQGKNKVADVRLNDTIKYYLNGEEGQGTVYAMTNEFFTVRKDTGGYQDIQISDIFFVQDIITENKSWAHMSIDERTEILHKARAPLSFVTRDWDDMPESIVNVIKSNFEQGKYGGVDTSIPFDADGDYESKPIIDDESNFKHDNVKPTTSTSESEQVPDSYKKPEVSVKDSLIKLEGDKVEVLDTWNGKEKDGEGKGDMATPMIAGAKSDDELEEEKKENSSMSTSDAGSFNAVHGSRGMDDRRNRIGKSRFIPDQSNSNGIGYGVEE